MENQPIGNTIFYKKEPLFYNITELKNTSINRYNGVNKKKIIKVIFAISLFLVFISIFIVAFFVDDKTIQTVLFIISLLGSFLLLTISLPFDISAFNSGGKISPTRYLFNFYDSEIYSSTYANDKQISTYVIEFSDIKKVIFYKDFITICLYRGNPITMYRNGFQSKENNIDFENMLKKKSISIIYSHK